VRDRVVFRRRWSFLDSEGLQCAGEDLVGGAVVVAFFPEFVDAHFSCAIWRRRDGSGR